MPPTLSPAPRSTASACACGRLTTFGILILAPDLTTAVPAPEAEALAPGEALAGGVPLVVGSIVGMAGGVSDTPVGTGVPCATSVAYAETAVAEAIACSRVRVAEGVGT